MATQISTPRLRIDTGIPATMRAVVYRGINDMRLETVPVPRIGPGELLIKIATCGVCGTDLKKIHMGSHSAPRIFGHEMAGVVAQVGAGVTRFAVGDRVMSFHHVPCGECYYCRKNTPAQCPLYKKTGATAGFEPSGGGFAEYVRVMDFVVNNGGVVAIPDGVPFEQAAFVEPLNTVLKGVKLLNLAPDDTVLVIGQGPIGLMHAALSKKIGARVLTSDLFAERHAIAARFGLTNPIHAGTENVVERVFAETEGRGADAVIVAVGGNALIKTAMDAVRPGGKVMLFAQTQHGEATFDPAAVCVDEKTLLGSYSSSFPILDEVTSLVFAGYRNGFDLTQLISHRFPFEDAAAAIEIASHPQPGSMKIMMEPVPGGRGRVREIEELMASTVKDAILRGRKTVKNVVEGGRKKVEDVVEGGLNTVETVVGAGLDTVESAVVVGRKTVETVVHHGRKTVENAFLSGRVTMRAAVLHGREDVRIEQVPIPKAAVGELVVRVGAALTCGTDLKVFRRGYHARMIVPPALFGHEQAGTVVEAGDAVTDFKPGDRVVALNSAPCGQCFFCLRGQENLCDDLIFNNGAYAEFIKIPARIVAKNTLIIPENVALEHAALTEPLACAVHGFEDSHPRKGDIVAIIGGGPLGLMILHVAALAGFETIAIVKHDGQVDAARQLGATHVVQAATVRKAIRETRALTPKDRGVDIAIEAVGTPETWQEAVELVRKGGTVNFFGGCAANTQVTLDTNRIHYSDITLRATFHHTPAICRKALQLISSGRFHAGAFITGRAHLYELNRVFEKLMNRSSEIKTAIVP